MKSSRRWLIVLVAFLGAIGACSSSSDSGDDETGELTIDRILTDASTAMSEVESAAFTIEQSGAAVFIDETNQLGFQSAVGRFASPSSAEALISVEALGFTTEVGAIAIDGRLWFTNPLSGDWTEAPESFSFDPALLFDPGVGFPALLAEATTTAELIDDDSSGGDTGAERHQVRTTVTPERVSVLTGGLVTEETDIDLWIDVDSSRVVEARFDLPTDDSVSNWLMTISDYDAEVSITPPDLGSNS